jgi:L-lysine exporter family protein LysE/ArgO
VEKIFFEGFILQASLIFALGAQNLFVLESGLKRQHHIAVSAVCFLCDLTLILLGVAGAATLFNAFPKLKIVIGIIGVIFLFLYGLQKFTRNEMIELSKESFENSTLAKSIMLAATVSILNPHAYLDAFILIGGYASKYPTLSDRITLGTGAAIYSGLWFVCLSTLSSLLKPFLLNPLRSRFIMRTAGLALILLSGKLALDVLHWVPIEVAPRMPDIILHGPPVMRLYTSILY